MIITNKNHFHKSGVAFGDLYPKKWTRKNIRFWGTDQKDIG